MEIIVGKRAGFCPGVRNAVEEYKKMIEKDYVEKLKNSEEQIKKGEVVDANIVFAKMRSKYGYEY